jgi:hypothetical protein
LPPLSTNTPSITNIDNHLTHPNLDIITSPRPNVRTIVFDSTAFDLTTAKGSRLFKTRLPHPYAMKKPTKRQKIVLYALCDGCSQKNHKSAPHCQANKKQKSSHNTPSASSKISRTGNPHPEAALARVQTWTLLWEIGMFPPDTLHTCLSAYLGYPSNPNVKIGELDNNMTWLHKLWALMSSLVKPQEQRGLKDVLGKFL